MPPAGTWGDQGDGTYVNPVLPGDFSDWDRIRVGADYYGITSPFGYSPGVSSCPRPRRQALRTRQPEHVNASVDREPSHGGLVQASDGSGTMVWMGQVRAGGTPGLPVDALTTGR